MENLLIKNRNLAQISANWWDLILMARLGFYKYPDKVLCNKASKGQE